MRTAGLVILAAGGSARMGRPKQLLPWRGRTLLRHAVKTALATPCRPVVVVLGRDAEACRRELVGLEVHIVENSKWSSGLGTSLACGVAALTGVQPRAGGVLLMLVDQPDVTPDFLHQLLAQWQAGALLVATRYPEGGGVPAIFDASFFPELRASSGDRGARILIGRETSGTVLIAPTKPLADLDTIEVYERHTSTPPDRRAESEAALRDGDIF